MAQKSGEIWTGPRLLQPVHLKSDRLLGPQVTARPFEDMGQQDAGIRARAVGAGKAFTGKIQGFLDRD